MCIRDRSLDGQGRGQALQPDAFPRQVCRSDKVRPGRQAAHSALLPAHLRQPAAGPGRPHGDDTVPRWTRRDGHDGALPPRPGQRQSHRRRAPRRAYRGVANRRNKSTTFKCNSGTVLVRILVRSLQNDRFWDKDKEKVLKSHDFRTFSGGDKRDRTADLLNAIQALSQLSYTPKRYKRYISRIARECQ